MCPSLAASDAVMAGQHGEKVWEGWESALGGGCEGGGFVCVPETE